MTTHALKYLEIYIEVLILVFDTQMFDQVTPNPQLNQVLVDIPSIY